MKGINKPIEQDDLCVARLLITFQWTSIQET